MRTVHVRVVGIAGDRADYPALIADALRARGLACELHSMPFVKIGELRSAVLRELRTELRKTPAEAVSVYCSGAAEFFLRGPEISVHFSAFRSWFDPQRMRVIPHPWTTAEPLRGQSLEWSGKPPFRIGFMGTGYANSRAGRLIGAMPPFAKQWLLQGQYLRCPDLLAGFYAAGLPLRFATTFPRVETLKAAESSGVCTGAEVRIVDTGGFTGQPEQVESYARHMAELTYVLCPRGAENYSYRLYEALKFGRVPVLVDTDMVLPDAIPWDELIVRVPYGKLSDIGQIIARDYERRSGPAFIRRQQLAFGTMAELKAGSWADPLVADVRRRLMAKSSHSQAKVLDSAVTV